MADPTPPASTPPNPPAQPSGPQLDCTEALRLIECFIEDGDLKKIEKELLFAHIKGCLNCRADLDARRRLDARLREAHQALETKSNFTRNVLAALPARVHPQPAPNDGLDRALRLPGAGLPVKPLPTRMRPLLVFGLVAAFILLGLLLSWLKFHDSLNPSDSPPIVAEVSGSGVRIHNLDKQALKGGEPLQPGDAISNTGSAPLVVKLQSGAGQAMAEVTLAPQATLTVHNRHQYELVGAGYFNVNKTRPGADRGETFEVDTPQNGKVAVVGTIFGIGAPPNGSGPVTVVVEEGVVKISSGKSELELRPDEEGDLLPGGGVSSVRKAVPSRLAWVHEPAQVVAGPVQSSPIAPPLVVPTLLPVPPTPKFDLSQRIMNLNLRGLGLAECLAKLGDQLGHPPEWQAIEKNALGEFGRAPHPSGLIIQGEMPLEAVLRWLARENGLSFEKPERWQLATRGVVFQPPEPGNLPERATNGLKAALKDIGAEADALVWLEKWTEKADVTVLFEMRPDKHLPFNEALKARTPEEALDAFSALSGLEWAYYDGLIYFTDPKTIEKLTFSPRELSAEDWIGKMPMPPPAWEKAFVNLAGAVVLWERPALDGPARLQDGKLKFNTGKLGERALHALLARLKQGSDEAALPAANLAEYPAPAQVRDIQTLAALALQKHVEVRIEGQAAAVPSGCFDTRGMNLAQAFEWSARLLGKGLRREGERIVVDDPAKCYGVPEWQALDLSDFCTAFPGRAADAPEALAKLLKQAAPELFKDVTFLPVRERLIVNCNRRQLQYAQQLKFEWVSECRTRANDAAFYWKAWRPAALVKLDRNLEQDFGQPEREGGMLPEQSFQFILRSIGVLKDLRGPVLVDPDALALVASKKIPAIEIKGKTIGQVLEALCQAAGLRMVLEDGAVWLRAKE